MRICDKLCFFEPCQRFLLRTRILRKPSSTLPGGKRRSRLWWVTNLSKIMLDTPLNLLDTRGNLVLWGPQLQKLLHEVLLTFIIGSDSTNKTIAAGYRYQPEL